MEIDIIEDVIPVYNIEVRIQTDKMIQRVMLVLQMEEIPFVVEGNK
ncbi:MAG: hypothetical protein RR525_07280 [Cellulosilyticaceae bacterium]